jgi:hypothetical protein
MMTLFQIMDTHPFAAGMAVGMMLTFVTMLLSSGFVQILVKGRNTTGSLTLPNGTSADATNPLRAIPSDAPDSTSIPSSDHQFPAVELPQ